MCSKKRKGFADNYCKAFSLLMEGSPKALIGERKSREGFVRTNIFFLHCSCREELTVNGLVNSLVKATAPALGNNIGAREKEIFSHLGR